jgi:hypothetical protein
MQYSDAILNENIAPKLGSLTKCGAPPLQKSQNHFAEFLSISVSGARCKKHLHALLIVFFRRVDFAGEEYRSARKKLRAYTSLLPKDNTQTLHYRFALCHFETCLLHLGAAMKCGEAICKSLKTDVHRDDREQRIIRLSNRVRHFDEDIFDNGNIKSNFGIAPIWITDDALEATSSSVSFFELRSSILELQEECVKFVDILRDSMSLKSPN